MSWNLALPLCEQRARTPARLALAADGAELTYADLAERAGRLAALLRAHGLGPGNRIGILGSRSLLAIEAVLGVAWAGAAYIPLGVRWPEHRIAAALALADCDALIVDGNGLGVITPALLATTRLVVLPTGDAVRGLAGKSENPRPLCGRAALPVMEATGGVYTCGPQSARGDAHDGAYSSTATP